VLELAKLERRPAEGAPEQVIGFELLERNLQSRFALGAGAWKARGIPAVIAGGLGMSRPFRADQPAQRHGACACAWTVMAGDGWEMGDGRPEWAWARAARARSRARRQHVVPSPSPKKRPAQAQKRQAPSAKRPKRRPVPRTRARARAPVPLLPVPLLGPDLLMLGSPPADRATHNRPSRGLDVANGKH
jgi:hypothetical protein